MLQLDLFSERVAPTGNASADGLKKVMGAPALDRLTVVVRESVQNSWDARNRALGNSPVEVRFNYRNLTEAQSGLLTSQLIDRIPDSAFGRKLTSWLRSNELTVLEVADYGTVGLSGPEHADEMTAPGEAAHFVDFIRNVGKTHEEVEGGTYGFGKSSFYALSGVSMIFVDTVTLVAGRPERRVMLAGLGEQYVAVENGIHRNFTGRHWWGERTGPDRIAPLTGEAARSFAESLGLPERSLGDTGTTIGVLAPRLNPLSEAEIASSLVRGILLNFWPKMVPEADRPAAINFSVGINGKAHPVPEPTDVPPFTYFVEALHRIRGHEEDPPTISTLRTGRPVVELGRLSLYSGPLLSRRDELLLADETDSVADRLFSGLPSASVAEMRSGELVVRYVPFERVPNPNYEWAGVFRTTSDADTERAFADSEPPTHDAWNVNALDNREHQRWLRSYTRQLREKVRAFLAPSNVPKGGSKSLGRASAALGAMLPGFGSSVAGPEQRTQGTSRQRTNQAGPGKLSKPRFREYRLVADRPAAVFESSWTPITGEAGKVRALVQPAILYEGRLVGSDELPPGMEAPRILEIHTGDASAELALRNGAIEFEGQEPLTLLVTVSIANELPAGLMVRLES